jgi:phosphatidylinositol glycan class O
LRRELTVVMAMSAFRTLLTTVCVAIQRRHLMVWAIFAPKFVFDGVMHVVQGALCVLVALLCSDGGERAGKYKAR